MNSYKYDIDAIIKRGDELDEKRSKIVSKLNEDIDYPVQIQNNAYFQKQNKITTPYEEYQKNSYSKKTSSVLDGLKPSNNTIDLFTNISADFKIDKNGTKVERVMGNENNKHCFICKEKVKYEGIVEFSFIIKSVDYAIFIGFIVDGVDLSKGASSSNQSWMIYLTNGRFLNAGTREMFCEYKKPEEEATFTLSIDTKTDEMSIRVNNEHLPVQETRKLIITNEQKANLLPCFDLRKMGDIVTIF